jgi:hypothetical protein
MLTKIDQIMKKNMARCTPENTSTSEHTQSANDVASVVASLTNTTISEVATV